MTDIRFMFEYAVSFDQSIAVWNLSSMKRHLTDETFDAALEHHPLGFRMNGLFNYYASSMFERLVLKSPMILEPVISKVFQNRF